MLFPIIVYIIFVTWLIYAWYQVPRIKNTIAPTDVFVSIVLPVRNEWPGVKGLLECIQEQTYPHFELIVVDDYSQDDIAFHLLPYLKESTIQCKFIQLSEQCGNTYCHTNNKKRAIAAGVEMAGGSLVICVDADIEMGRDWLKSMVIYFQTTGHQFFCAPVLFKKQNSIWGKFLEVDQITNMAVAEATTNVQKPFLAAGANMAFTSQAWNKVRGFHGVEDIVSGDDMFLLQRIEKMYPGEIGFNSARDAIVFTKPVSSLEGFIHQRVRWFSKSMSYERMFGFLILMGILLFNMYVVTQIFLLAFSFHSAMLILTLKMLCDILFIAAPLSKYDRSNAILFIPFFSILTALYIVCIACITPFWKFKWKPAK